MIKKILFPAFLFLISCNSPNPAAKTVNTRTHSKRKTTASRPPSGPWIIKAYPAAQDGTDARKYVMLETDGNFSNSTSSKNYLNADIIVDKVNAGILLHPYKKSSPLQKFTGPVRIRMKNSAGNELEMTSSRGWNKSGGILIERNNNDYSQFRIFMLQSDGIINVEISDDSSSQYHFDINVSGFADAFGQI